MIFMWFSPTEFAGFGGGDRVFFCRVFISVFFLVRKEYERIFFLLSDEIMRE